MVSAKIEHIDLWPGDHIFVRVRGCAELNVLVEVAKDGKATVRGPFNCQSRTFEILKSGLRKLPNAEAHGRAVARTVQPLVGASGSGN
jgi:hypothetical protein